MLKQITPVDFERPFTCISTSNAKRTTSEEIAKQIAEFEQRGKTIMSVPTGIGALAAGAVIVSEEPDAMATPRPPKNPRKCRASTSDESPFVNLKEAAMILGCKPPAVTRKVSKGELIIAGISEGTGEKLVRRDSVIALKNAMQQRMKK